MVRLGCLFNCIFLVISYPNLFENFYLFFWFILLCLCWEVCLLLLFSRLVICHSLRPHGLQLARLPCPAPFPEAWQTLAWVNDAIQPSRPLQSPSPAFNLSSIKAFSNESVLRIRWPKYWNFNFSISLPMNIHGWLPLGLTGLISLQSSSLWWLSLV